MYFRNKNFFNLNLDLKVVLSFTFRLELQSSNQINAKRVNITEVIQYDSCKQIPNSRLRPTSIVQPQILHSVWFIFDLRRTYIS